MEQAFLVLKKERLALFDDATQDAAFERIAAVATRRGSTYDFADGSQIVFDPMAGSVTAIDSKSVANQRGALEGLRYAVQRLRNQFSPEVTAVESQRGG